MRQWHRPSIMVVAACVAAAAVLNLGVQVVAAASAHDAVSAGDMTTPAWFEDHWIDLADDWQDARACDVGALSERVAVCFRDERALDDALAAISTYSTCSSSLRLYTGASFSGIVLNLSQQGTLNLSNYSFDNVTSSYKVGACDTTFHSDVSGTGYTYPGNTAAGAQSTTMVFGWDNVVSSVTIY